MKSLSSKKKSLKTRCITVFIGFVIVVIVSMITRYHITGSLPHFLAEMKFTMGSTKLSLSETGEKILTALSQKDFASLSEYLADEGVDFLPYPYEENLDRVQTIQKEKKSDFSSLFSGNEVLTRWIRDGSWEPLSMTFEEYYQRFIRDENYLQAPEKFENEQVQSRGNTMVNLSTLYSWSQIIEYHFTGFNEEFAGMDWKSLYLVFTPSEWENLKLRAIAHGEWTI